MSQKQHFIQRSASGKTIFQLPSNNSTINYNQMTINQLDGDSQIDTQVQQFKSKLLNRDTSALMTNESVILDQNGQFSTNGFISQTQDEERYHQLMQMMNSNIQNSNQCPDTNMIQSQSYLQLKQTNGLNSATELTRQSSKASIRELSGTEQVQNRLDQVRRAIDTYKEYKSEKSVNASSLHQLFQDINGQSCLMDQSFSDQKVNQSFAQNNTLEMTPLSSRYKRRTGQPENSEIKQQPRSQEKAVGIFEYQRAPLKDTVNKVLDNQILNSVKRNLNQMMFQDMDVNQSENNTILNQTYAFNMQQVPCVQELISDMEEQPKQQVPQLNLQSIFDLRNTQYLQKQNLTQQDDFQFRNLILPSTTEVSNRSMDSNHSGISQTYLINSGNSRPVTPPLQASNRNPYEQQSINHQEQKQNDNEAQLINLIKELRNQVQLQQNEIQERNQIINQLKQDKEYLQQQLTLSSHKILTYIQNDQLQCELIQQKETQIFNLQNEIRSQNQQITQLKQDIKPTPTTEDQVNLSEMQEVIKVCKEQLCSFDQLNKMSQSVIERLERQVSEYKFELDQAKDTIDRQHQMYIKLACNNEMPDTQMEERESVDSIPDISHYSQERSSRNFERIGGADQYQSQGQLVQSQSQIMKTPLKYHRAPRNPSSSKTVEEIKSQEGIQIQKQSKVKLLASPLRNTANRRVRDQVIQETTTHQSKWTIVSSSVQQFR